MSNDLLATFGRDGRFQYLNPAWETTLGWSLEELRSQRAVDFVHEDDLATTLALAPRPGRPMDEVVNFENRYRTKEGGYRWLLWSASSHEGTWYAVAKDVTDRKELERRALQDPLTVIFPTCAAMHGVYAYYTLAGSYTLDAHMGVVDWLAVPAGVYFLWVVQALYRGTFRDWNSAGRLIPSASSA